MVGLVLGRDDGTLYTSGVAGADRKSISRDELEDLIRRGDAFNIEGFQATTEPLAALWVGHEFDAKTNNAGVPVPPLPPQSTEQVAEGRLWVAPVRHVWLVIDSWIVQSFRRAVLGQNADLAALMSWVMPQRIETRAARWYTSDKKTREKELEWWVRLDRGSGHPRGTTGDLVASFDRLVDDVKKPKKNAKVVGFSALAKGGDKEIATSVANQAQLTRVSFGHWLQSNARLPQNEPPRLVLQARGNEIIRERGELFLSLEVLRGVDNLLQDAFVIEGIRHLNVLESVRSVVGPDRFVLAFVERPLKDRVERLQREERLTKEQVRQVMNDPTEQQIPEIRKLANYTLDGNEGEAEATRLVRQLGI